MRVQRSDGETFLSEVTLNVATILLESRDATLLFKYAACHHDAGDVPYSKYYNDRPSNKTTIATGAALSCTNEVCRESKVIRLASLYD